MKSKKPKSQKLFNNLDFEQRKYLVGALDTIKHLFETDNTKDFNMVLEKLKCTVSPDHRDYIDANSVYDLNLAEVGDVLERVGKVKYERFKFTPTRQYRVIYSDEDIHIKNDVDKLSTIKRSNESHNWKIVIEKR